MKFFLFSLLLPDALGSRGREVKEPEDATSRDPNDRNARTNRGSQKIGCRYHALINSQIESELSAAYFYFRHSLFYSSIASPR